MNSKKGLIMTSLEGVDYDGLIKRVLRLSGIPNTNYRFKRAGKRITEVHFINEYGGHVTLKAKPGPGSKEKRVYLAVREYFNF